MPTSGSWDSSSQLINADAYVGGWHKASARVGADGRVAFSIDGKLLWTSTQAMDSKYLSGRRLILGSRSSGSAGKAYHDNVTVTKGVGNSTGKWTALSATGVASTSPALQQLSGLKYLLVSGGTNGSNGCGSGQNQSFTVDFGSSTITQTGNLSIARNEPISMGLRDGRVVVFLNDSNCSSSQNDQSEIYSPTTGVWSLGPKTAGLFYGRPEWTQLSDGRWLIAGGETTATANLFDPASGTFSAVAATSTPRHVAATEPLPDGGAIIAGGVDGAPNYNILASTLKFTPSTGQWNTTGALNVARAYPAHAALSDGRILVVGGMVELNYKNTATASAEIYDPATGRWTVVGNLNKARYQAKAVTLANGKVLIVGGGTQSTASIYLTDLVAETELFDPATNTFTLDASLNAPRRSSFALTKLSNGNVVVVNGSGSANDSSLDSIEVYTPSQTSGAVALAVTTSGTGFGTVTSNPAGINCPGSCSALYGANASVSLTATASSGSTFVGWSGACTGFGDCVVNMNTAKSVSATFKLIPFAVVTTGVTNGVITAPIATVSSTITFKPADIDKTGSIFITAVVPASSQKTLLSETWESGSINASAWTAYGSPAPKVVAAVGGRSGYVFDNNGDSNYDSGVFSAQAIDLTGGGVVEADIFLDFNNPAGCWAGASFGLTESTAPVSSSINPDWGGFFWAMDAAGDACWASAADHLRKSWFSFGVMPTSGSWDSSSQLINADAYVGGWHKARVNVGSDGHASFSIDGKLLWTASQAIAAKYLTGRRLILGSRSSGSAGKAYHDNIKVSKYFQTGAAAASGLSKTMGASGALEVSASPDFLLLQLTPSGWQQVINGQLIPYFTGLNGAVKSLQDIIKNTNTDGLAGAQFCVGYGSNAADMIANGTMQVIAKINPKTGATEFSCLVTDSLTVTSGWNLLGNSRNQSFQVADKYSDAGWVTSVWKWDAARQQWMIYSPAMDAGALQSLATEKGYALLGEIKPGEGYWVNAAAARPVVKMSGTAFNLSASKLVPGWNLVTTETAATPSALSASLGVSLTSLWAWDTASQTWYFYAPSLEAQGGSSLRDYVNSKGLIDFNAYGKTLGSGVGFWLNKP
jgi:hypothetical protein